MSWLQPKSFGSLEEAWHVVAAEILRDGQELEGRNGPTLELLGVAFRIVDPTDAWVRSRTRKAAPSYFAAELLWYLSGSNDGATMCAYSERYADFLNDGKAYGAYGRRWADGNQLQSVVDLLRRHAHTRQAVVASWSITDVSTALAGDKKDLPCTLGLQFLLRRGQLNLITKMRSNDWWLGMPYDVACFCGLQRLVAWAIGARLGWYQHEVGSLHCYRENHEGLLTAAREEMIQRDATVQLGPGSVRDWWTLRSAIDVAVGEETRIRTGGPPTVRPEVVQLLGGPDAMMTVLVEACARKFMKEKS